MQEKHLFEYAVIRIVPRVEREEFLNAGIILYCPSKQFLQCSFELDEARLLAFSPLIEIGELQYRLDAFTQICAGKKEAGTIGRLPMASRFRWLTAMRSTVLQTSRVHPGLCPDPQETLTRLHEQLVKCDLQ